MQNIQDNDDPDQQARTQAALAAQARARQVAAGIAQEHADSAYERARQNAAPICLLPKRSTPAPETVYSRRPRPSLRLVACTYRVSTVSPRC